MGPRNDRNSNLFADEIVVFVVERGMMLWMLFLARDKVTDFLPVTWHNFLKDDWFQRGILFASLHNKSKDNQLCNETAGNDHCKYQKTDYFNNGTTIFPLLRLKFTTLVSNSQQKRLDFCTRWMPGII